MRNKGSILLILLIALLFASAALLQLSEDNYLAHLIAGHVDDSSNARKSLKVAFKKLSASSVQNQACFTSANTENELNDFWKTHVSCQTAVSGTLVNYAVQVFEQEQQKSSYLQYTLSLKTNAASMWLRVLVGRESGLVVSWASSV